MPRYTIHAISDCEETEYDPCALDDSECDSLEEARALAARLSAGWPYGVCIVASTGDVFWGTGAAADDESDGEEVAP